MIFVVLFDSVGKNKCHVDEAHIYTTQYLWICDSFTMEQPLQ